MHDPDDAIPPADDEQLPSTEDETPPPTAAGAELAHPPFARSPDEYTDPPGHHRRGPTGPALDVGG